MILGCFRLEAGMIEVVLGSLTLLVCVVSLWMIWVRTAELGMIMKTEGEMAAENLNHIAHALVGVSELLDEGENLVEQVSAIPTAGEILAQVMQSFLLSKLQSIAPTISPILEENMDLISQGMSGPAHGTQESEGETQTQDAV